MNLMNSASQVIILYNTYVYFVNNPPAKTIHASTKHGLRLNFPYHLKPIHATNDGKADNELKARIANQQLLGDFVEGGAGTDCVINMEQVFAVGG